MVEAAACDIMMDLLVMYGIDSRQVKAFMASQKDRLDILEVLETCIRVHNAVGRNEIEWPWVLKGDTTE